jgi:predicted DsbA family dithiol-disulfide isomerase
MHARQVSGVPIYDRIWFEDPPASSWPACIAVKCALLQSFQAAEAYLGKAREAVMAQGINIAKETALLDIAGRLAAENPLLLDTALFSDDLKNGRGMELFRKDIQDVQYRGIDRFPTLILRYGAKPSVIVTGYRPYEVLLEIIQEMVKEPAG